MATGKNKTEITVSAKDKTKAGLTSAQRNLKKTSKEAQGLANRFRSVARATAVLEGPLGGTAGRLSTFATLLGSVNPATIAFGLGMTALTATVLSSLKAFSQWESQQLKTEQLLKQTGGASGLAAFEIEEMAIRIGKATLSSADDVRSASGVLLTFKSIAEDSFGRTLDVASDLAAITGQDLKQSVIQLGKALDDPAAGMSALRRVGISFTDSQKDVIVQMNKTGDIAGSQAAILELLEGQLGGAGAAQGKGLAGAADLVTENWSLMLIQLANTGAGQAATDMLNAIASGIESITGAVTTEISVERQLSDIYFEIVEKRREMAMLTKEGSNNAGNIRRIQLLAEEALQLEAMGLKIQTNREEEIAAAREKGRVAREENVKTKNAEALAQAAKKKGIEDAKQLEKDKGGAAKFGENLAKESEALAMSFLTKGQQEDLFLEGRLNKIQMNNDMKLLTDAEAYAQEQDAFAIHNANMTTIQIEEKEKRLDAEMKLDELQKKATGQALGDLATLMGSHSKKAFKIGKAAAISQAVFKGFSAATSAWDAGMSTGGPHAPLVAAAYTVASIAKTTAQIQQLKSSKFSGGREHGGSTIGGRTYLVGEKGPELFTSPRSGQIINNSTTSSIGGQSNIINVTVINDTGEEFIERNAIKIWESVTDKMNEEGLRFA